MKVRTLYTLNKTSMLAAIILSIFIPASAIASSSSITLSTSQRNFDVSIYASPGTASRPIVLVLSGAKGYQTNAYERLIEGLNSAGVDAALIHYLSAQDTNTIEHAASASARIAFYAKRMSDWTETVQVTIDAIRNRPKYQSKIGIVGISLGSMPAAVASANNKHVSVSAIIDGGFPPNFKTALRWMPPVLMIWGEDDQVFSVRSATALRDRIRLLGNAAELHVFPNEGHAFFLEDRNRDADEARREIVEFFARYLR